MDFKTILRIVELVSNMFLLSKFLPFTTNKPIWNTAGSMRGALSALVCVDDVRVQGDDYLRHHIRFHHNLFGTLGTWVCWKFRTFPCHFFTPCSAYRRILWLQWYLNLSIDRCYSLSHLRWCNCGHFTTHQWWKAFIFYCNGSFHSEWRNFSNWFHYGIQRQQPVYRLEYAWRCIIYLVWNFSKEILFQTDLFQL